MAKTSSIIKPLTFWALLLLVMTVTQPNQLPVLFLIVPYALLWGALYYSAHLIIGSIITSSDSMSSLTRIRRLSVIVATGGVFFIALQSIGQLTPRDVVVATLLIIIGHFYLNRNKSR